VLFEYTGELHVAQMMSGASSAGGVLVLVNLGGGRAALCHARERHNAFARMARRGGVEQAQRRCIGRLPMLAVLDRAASFFRPFTSRSAAMRPGSRSARRSDRYEEVYTLSVLYFG